MRTTLSLTLLSALAASGIAAAEPERAEWWSVERDVIEKLFQRDAGQWARELHAQDPATTPGELMRRFTLFNRAGHLRQVRLVIDAMIQANIETAQLSLMADFLIDRKDWPTTRYFLERLPQAEPGWGYVFVKEWANTTDAGQIDAWLAERAKANPAYWLRERLRFGSDQGTAGELIEELAKEVRQRPQDAEVALQFLEATSMVNPSERNLAWLGQVCRPRSAYASYRVGKALRSAPHAAVAVLEHGLDMPFTGEDLAALKEEMKHWAVAHPAPTPQSLERQIRYSTKHELLTALQAAGESQRAQKLLEELAGMQADGLPPGGLERLAGQVQAASGARVVQQRFHEAEAEVENEQSAEYWLKRAAYYTGRREPAEAITAYEKALQLAPPDPDKPVGGSSGTMRSSVLSSYVWMLEHSDQQPRAVQLLERELRGAPPHGVYAQRIVNILLNTRRDTLSTIDRQWLWDYLAATKQWSHQEERLLWRLVDQPADQPQQKWQRAEALARDGDPSRSLVLGWVMTRSDASERAIPWLKSAWERLEKPEERGRAAFNLFDAYLDVSDWRAAEAIWPAARKQLTPNETPEWLGRIAVAAAHDGSQIDAVRLWQQRTNLDRASKKNLDEMLRSGMREPLLTFYRALTERDPDCQSVDPVIEQIRKFRNGEPQTPASPAGGRV